MKVVFDIEMKDDYGMPYADISLVELDGIRRWHVTSISVNPLHARKTEEELAVELVAYSLQRLIDNERGLA